MDIWSAKKRSEVMSRIRSRLNRSTECKLVASLRSSGVVGWRRHATINVGVSVKPDFVFRRHLLAVFVDGCFWHRCPVHGRLPRSNQSFWREKLEGNRRRDRRTDRLLRKKGWSVVRIWEHSMEGNPDACVRRIVRMLGKKA